MRIGKRILSVLMIICLLLSSFSVLTMAASREYAANAYINDVLVAFENAAYEKNGIIFVPLEEACTYMNIDMQKDSRTYTLKHGDNTVVMQEGNMIVRKNGEALTIADQTWNKGDVVYAPVELFSEALEIDLTLDLESRRVYFRPNIYRKYITADNAAMVDMADPDKDLLKTGTDESDGIIYNKDMLSEVEKSLYYKFDLSDFTGKNITNAVLTAYCGLNSNLNPHLGAIRTELWEKGSITNNTAPAHHKDASIKEDPTLLTASTHGQGGKNYLPHSITITDWARDALKSAEPLSVKLLGIPQVKGNTSPQIMVKGVNTHMKAYISVTIDEAFTFPKGEESKETDIDRNTFDKLAFLTKLGVFKDGEEFPADITTGVTRREFVTYAIRLLNDFSYDENAKPVFADVPLKSPSYGEIMDCVALGLVAPVEGGLFRPDDIITYDEALTVIGRMLGYGTYASYNGGFSQGYVSAAMRTDLTDGVISHKGIIGFDSMFNLFFNALDAPMFEPAYYTNNGVDEYVFNKDSTLLQIYWGLKKVEGRVDGNEYTNLNPGTSGTDGSLIIDGVKYRIDNPNYNALLGYEVEGYYTKDKVILYLGSTVKTKDIEIIDFDDIISFKNDLNGISFSYEKSNGKIVDERIDKTDTVVYNGKTITSSDIKASLLEKTAGSITYVDDVVFITAYTTVVVYDVDVKNKVITDKYAPYDNTLRLSGAEYYVFKDKEANSVEIDELEANDVISAAVSLDKKVITAEISKEKITGKVTELTDDKITINGFVYQIPANNLSWTTVVNKLGVEGTFFIDAFGNIAGYRSSGAASKQFGYVLSHAYSGSGLRKQSQIAVVTSGTEEPVAYNLAEKVTIDGESCDSDEKILSALGISNGEIRKQGIVFSLNNEHKISKIDTPVFNEAKENADTSLHLRFAGTSDNKLHYKTSGRLGDLFYWDRSTALNVLVPADETDIEEYQYFRSGLTNDKSYQADVYSIGKNHPKADIVVIRGASTQSTVDGNIAIAGKRVVALDENGDTISKLYYYTASSNPSYVTIPNDFMTDTDITESSRNTLSDLNPGDIIRVGRDFNGKLTAISRYYNYSTQSFEQFSYEDDFDNKARIYGGFVTSKYDSYVRFTPDRTLLDDETAYMEATEDEFRWVDLNMTGGDKYVFKYEVMRNSDLVVEKATAQDAIDYEHVPYAPSGIILQTTFGQQIDACYIVNVTKPENSGIYEITFEPGEEAAGTMTSLRRDIGNTVVLPPNGFLHNDPAYGFDHWSCDGKNYYPGDKITVTGDMTITANWKWVGIQYDVTYNGNGADSGSVVGTRALEGTDITLAVNPADTGFVKSGYKFAGWRYNGVLYKAGGTFTMPANDVTFTAEWTECWDGGKSEPELSGDVYRISNGAELKWFADYVNSGNPGAKAELTRDIVLNLENEYDTEWTAIGNSSANAYTGTFDGKGYSIKGLYNKSGTSSYTGGLFGRIGSGGTVKNVNIAYGKLISQWTQDNNLAGIAMIAGTITDGTIYGCTAEGIITNDGSGTYINGCAGIVGAVNGASTVERCISRVKISSDGTTMPTNFTSPNLGVGGIAAKIQGTSQLYQCGNEGEIYAPGYAKVAGVAGANYSRNAVVSQCYNTADITGIYTVAGIVAGISGNHSIDAANYNRGNITATGNGRAAGLWVDAYTAKGGSYTTGTVDMPAADDNYKSYSGVAYAPINKSKKTFTEYIYVIPEDKPATAIAHAISKDEAGNTYAVSGVDMTSVTNMDSWVSQLNTWAGAGVYTTDSGINDGYPIFVWQTAVN